MTERHLIAYAILLVLLVAAGAALAMRLRRRARRAGARHLRIDLTAETEKTVAKP